VNRKLELSAIAAITAAGTFATTKFVGNDDEKPRAQISEVAIEKGLSLKEYQSKLADNEKKLRYQKDLNAEEKIKLELEINALRSVTNRMQTGK